MLAWRFTAKPDPEGAVVRVARRAVALDASPDAWMALLVGTGTHGAIVELDDATTVLGKIGPVFGARSRRCCCTCDFSGALADFAVARGAPERAVHADPRLWALLFALCDGERLALDVALHAHLLESAEAAA